MKLAYGTVLVSLLLFACSEGTSVAPLTCDESIPSGLEIGDTLRDLTFQTCDGEAFELRDLCASRAALAVNFYAWCPSCYDNLDLAVGFQEEYRDEGLRVLVVITEDAVVEPPSLEFCSGLVEELELTTVTTVIDPDAEFAEYGTTDLTLVTGAGGVIISRRRDATEESLETAIQTALGH